MEGTSRSCSVKGCKRTYRAKGYCNIHFRKWRRGEMENKPRYKTCSGEECHKRVHLHGLCEEHYNAWVTSRKGAAPAAPASAPKVEEMKKVEEKKAPAEKPTEA